MDDKSLWGLLLLIYILPFGLWQMWNDPILETRKHLYSGSENLDREERRFTSLSLLWSMGLIVILAVWNAGWHPLSAAIMLFGTTLIVLLARGISKRWQLMSHRVFRVWLAATALWLFSTVSWYLTIGRLSYLNEEEYFYIVMPPVIAGFALGAWSWATNRR